MQVHSLRAVVLERKHLNSNLSSDLLVALGCSVNVSEPQSYLWSGDNNKYLAAPKGLKEMVCVEVLNEKFISLKVLLLIPHDLRIPWAWLRLWSKRESTVKIIDRRNASSCFHKGVERWILTWNQLLISHCLKCYLELGVGGWGWGWKEILDRETSEMMVFISSILYMCTTTPGWQICALSPAVLPFLGTASSLFCLFWGVFLQSICCLKCIV